MILINSILKPWRFTSQQMLSTIIIISVVLLATGLIALGQINTLAKIVIVVVVALCLFKHPLFALFAWMIVDTNFFQFIAMSQVPYLQLVPGLRVNLSDALIALLMVVAIQRLLKRREKPLFWVPFVMWAVMVVFSYVWHFLTGNVDLDSGMNVLRQIIGYSTYLIYIELIENPRILRKVVLFWLVIMVLSIGLQVTEVIFGQRLSLWQWGLGVKTYYGKMVYVMAGGFRLPYFWNRAWLYSQIALYLSLGALFEMKGKTRSIYFVLTIVGVLGVLIALIRQVYFSMILGVLTLLILQRKRIRSVYMLVLLVVILVGLVTLSRPWVTESYPEGALQSWGKRAGTLRKFQSVSTFQVRVSENQKTWYYVLQSPLMGYGPGKVWQQLKGHDVGIMNTLLLYGFVGVAVILFVLLTTFWCGFHVLKRLPPGLERGYVAGALAFFVGIVALSVLGGNYLTSGTTIALVMAIIDRVNAFARDRTMAGSIPEAE